MDENDFIIPEGSNKAVHMIGEWVGVCWKTHEVKKEIISDGIRYSATVEEIEDKTKPFIQFINLRKYRDDKIYEDDNHRGYVMDYHQPKEARKMAAELIAAADYIEKLQEDNNASHA